MLKYGQPLKPRGGQRVFLPTILAKILTWRAQKQGTGVAGFEAYLVGGAVRDLLLGQEPKDYDILTTATPRQVRC